MLHPEAYTIKDGLLMEMVAWKKEKIVKKIVDRKKNL